MYKYSIDYGIPYSAMGGGLPTAVNPFTPLTLEPVFWFDYNTYSTGALAGTEKDVTDTYTITPFNGATITLDGTIKSLDVTRATADVVGYGDTFQTEMSAPNTQVIVFKPNSDPAFDCVYGTQNATGQHAFGLFQAGKKLYVYHKINNVTDTFDTTNDCITAGQYNIVVMTFQQSGVTIRVNGVDQPLNNSSYTQTLSNYLADRVLYCGARNINNVPTTAMDGFVGDHILYDKILTPTEISNLENYLI